MEKTKILTSRPTTLVLIVDDKCEKEYRGIVNSVLDGTEWGYIIPILNKSCHKAVTVSYNIKKFPTLLAFDMYSRLVSRIEDKAMFNKDFFTKAISFAASNRNEVGI